MHKLLWITSAGFAAGAINAAAGGGSFLSVSTLIWAGIPPVTANMCSTIALYPGSFTSACGYRGFERCLLGVSFRRLCVTTLAGGFGGALLLLKTPNAIFEALLPWLMLLGSVAFAFGQALGRRIEFDETGRPRFLLLGQFVLGLYGGYFGGAVGLMMMALWGVLGVHDVIIANPIKVLLVAAANSVAVLCFIFVGSVAWRDTLLMSIAAAGGGYVGAQLALRINRKYLRRMIATLNFSLTLVLFVQQVRPLQ